MDLCCLFKFGGWLISRGIILARLHTCTVHALSLSLPVLLRHIVSKKCFLSRKEININKYSLLYTVPCTSFSHICQLFYSSETACPTVLLAQSLKVIYGFLMLWPSVLSHVNFDLRKLLPGQQEMTLPPIVQQLTLQILLQVPPGSLKWYQQVSITQQISIYSTSNVKFEHSDMFRRQDIVGLVRGGAFWLTSVPGVGTL